MGKAKRPAFSPPMGHDEVSLEVDGQRVWFGSSEQMPFVPDESVDLVVTSPPYWNLKRYGAADEIGHEPYGDYLDRLGAVWAECFRAARDDAVLIVNVANRRHRKEYFPISMDVARTMEGWRLWDVLIWYVPNALPQPNHYRERLFDTKHEYLLVFVKGSPEGYEFHKPRVQQKYAADEPRNGKMNPAGRCLGSVIRVPAYRPPNIRQMGYYIAAWPEELVALLVQSFSSPGSVVLDPFLGSGTTLKVARAMSRLGIGIEVNAGNAPLIRQRIAEPFAVPNRAELDLIHATMNGTERSDLRRPTGEPPMEPEPIFDVE